MARNESLARIVMLLCFGTALLTMSVRLYTSSSVSSMAPMASSKKAEYLKTQKLKSQDLEAQNSTKNDASITDRLAKFLQLDRANTNTNDTARASSPQESSLNSKTSRISKESRLVVDLSDRRVYVYRMGEVIASYPTGIGKKVGIHLQVRFKFSTCNTIRFGDIRLREKFSHQEKTVL